MTNLYFSVVVCTYNRYKYLKKCIDSLLRQSINKSSFEILVMDDGSTDETEKLIQKYKKKVSVPKIHYFKSNNIGLAHSRNLALKQAKSKYIAFIDDDAKADLNWLENALKHFKKFKHNNEIKGITGPVLPYYLVKKPNWFKDEYEADIKGNSSRYLKYGESFSGPNMILNAVIVKKFKGFGEDIDMKADVLMVGEETKFFERIWQKYPSNKFFYYATDIKVYHLVHPYKMTVVYRLKRWFASGQSYYLRNKNKSLVENILLFLKVNIYFCLKMLIALISILIYRFYQNWVVERIGPLAFAFGFYSVYFKIPVVMKSKSRY